MFCGVWKAWSCFSLSRLLLPPYSPAQPLLAPLYDNSIGHSICCTIPRLAYPICRILLSIPRYLISTAHQLQSQSYLIISALPLPSAPLPASKSSTDRLERGLRWQCVKGMLRCDGRYWRGEGGKSEKVNLHGINRKPNHETLSAVLPQSQPHRFQTLKKRPTLDRQRILG